MMKKDSLPAIFIFDNFFDDLSWVSKHISSSRPIEIAKPNYAGLSFIPPESQRLFAINKINSLAELNLSTDPSTHLCEMRLIAKEHQETYNTFIHADTNLNLLIYLQGDESEDEGTTFYKHNQLGITNAFTEIESDLKMRILYHLDNKKIERWSPCANVKFRLNRAVLFDGRFFHAPPKSCYGDTLENSRVTQNFFFKLPNNLYETKFFKTHPDV